MSLHHSERTLTVKQMFKMKDKFNFSLAIQRNKVWEDAEDRKTLLIDSLLNGYYVPNVLAMSGENDDYLWVIDGQQRLTTIFDYLEDAFPLTDEASEVNGEDVSGLYFSQLSEDLQDEINDATITIVEFKNLTDDERDSLFYRLNNGMPLSSVEKLRSIAGSGTMDFVNAVAKEKFFAESVPLSKTGRKRFEDEQLIFKIMMLLSNDGNALEISSKEIDKYVLSIKDTDFSELQETIRVTTKYLNDAFPVKEKHLKKATVPIVFVMATKALKKDIAPEKFGGWLQQFFSERVLPGSLYKKGTGSGTDKKENVQIRLSEMEKDFNKHIQKAADYKIPEPKVYTGKKRGRKPKNETQDQQEQSENVPA